MRGFLLVVGAPTSSFVAPSVRLPFFLPTPPLAPAPLNEGPCLFILRDEVSGQWGGGGCPSPRGPHSLCAQSPPTQLTIQFLGTG